MRIRILQLHFHWRDFEFEALRSFRDSAHGASRFCTRFARWARMHPTSARLESSGTGWGFCRTMAH